MSADRHSGVTSFSETDASGRFHYTNALEWAENAEHEIYRAVGASVTSFPRRAVSATFERPFVGGDEYWWNSRWNAWATVRWATPGES